MTSFLSETSPSGQMTLLASFEQVNSTATDVKTQSGTSTAVGTVADATSSTTAAAATAVMHDSQATLEDIQAIQQTNIVLNTLLVGGALFGLSAVLILLLGGSRASAPPAAATPAAAPEEVPPVVDAEKLAQLQRLKDELAAFEVQNADFLAQRAEARRAVQQAELELEMQQRSQMGGATLEEVETRQAARAVDAEANQGLQLIYEKVMPVFVQANRLQEVVNQRVEGLKTRLPQVINEEVRSGVKDLFDILDEGIPGLGETIRQMSQPTESLANLPPMSLVLAGYFAPVQLKAIMADAVVKLGFTAGMFLMDGIALALAIGHPCITKGFYSNGGSGITVLHNWMAVDFSVLGFTLLVCASVTANASKTLQEISEMQTVTGTLPEDPREAFRVQMEQYLEKGAKAMLMADYLSKSTSYRMLPFFNIFDFFWQSAGWVITFNTPGVTCQATTLLIWSRCRGCLFLIGLLPAIIGVGMSVVRLALQSPQFAQAMLQAAHAADNNLFPTGPPLCVVFVRAFFLRDSTDMASVELQVLRAEQYRITQEHDRLRAERAKLDAELVGVEAAKKAAEARAEEQAQVLATDHREQMFMIQYRQAVQSALNVATVAQGIQSGNVTEGTWSAAAQLGGMAIGGTAGADVSEASSSSAAQASQVRGAATQRTAAATSTSQTQALGTASSSQQVPSAMPAATTQAPGDGSPRFGGTGETA